ncbi:MAG: hypothetical protein AB8B85_06845 [Paracoccaceae bacterium]
MADFGVISGPTIALAISTAATIGTSVLAASAAKAKGEAEQEALNFEASQLDDRAEEERAIASQEVAENRRQRELVLSRARAAGGASGGGRDFDLEAELEEEAEYRRLTALHDGNVRARNARTSAAVRRGEGARAKQAGNIAFKSGIFRAGSTLASSGASMYSKYA